jgi:thiol-disulfide isomerase/thioredoxin
MRAVGLLAGFTLIFSSTVVGQVWNCGLQIQNQILPFKLERQATSDWILWNGNEKIQLDQVVSEGDSLKFPILVFDAWVKIPKQPGALFTGSYSKGDARNPGYQMSFLAKISKDKSPFKLPVLRKQKEEEFLIYFLDQKGLKADSGILRLNHFLNSDRLAATILTETGDFRYLNGTLTDTDLRLSTFDGGHTYLFRAAKVNDKFVGRFFYSRTGSDSILIEPAKGRKLQSGFKQANGIFSFSALERSGTRHTEKDADFIGKPLVVQLMGTWCPNCMDESRFLAEVFPLIQTKVALVGLAFERKFDQAYGFDRIELVRRKLQLPYPVYLAGPASKDSASLLLPSIAPVQAFPTTVFVRADGSILKVHSGFSGPATGNDYQVWREEFFHLVNELAEKK